MCMTIETQKKNLIFNGLNSTFMTDESTHSHPTASYNDTLSVVLCLILMLLASLLDTPGASLFDAKLVKMDICLL